MLKRKKSSQKQIPKTRSGTTVLSAARLRVLAGAVLIAIAAFLAYLPSLGGGFILDDDQLLTNNSLIRASDGLFRFWCSTEAMDYWPVTNTTLWIEWRLWGMDPAGYRAANLILHIVECLLIWIILRKLSIPGAFLAAMIFAVHPVNVDSVAWIASRKNLMAMLFFLLSILCYLKFIEPARRPTFRRRPLAAKPYTAHCPPPTAHSSPPTYSSFILHPSSFYWLSLAAFVLGMLSKGSVAILPLLLLGIIWWRRGVTRWDLARTAPFFVIAAVLTVVNIWFQTHGEEIVIRAAGFVERLLGAGGVLWFYLYKALLPVDLVFIYPQWHIQAGNLLWWLPLSASVILTAVLWQYRRGWSRPFLFAWGFFCVSLVQVMGFTDVGFMRFSLVADRYQHIAIIGVIALAAAGWSIWRERTHGLDHSATTVTAAVVVCALIFLTRQQSGLYRDAITLYQATLQKNPNCWLAHYNLGTSLIQADQLPEAIIHFQQALKFKPDYPEALYNLGNALSDSGRYQEAIGYYEQALRLKPDLAMAYNNLGNALLKLGRLPQAIENFERAIQLEPKIAEIHNNLGTALVQAGLPQEAIKHYQQALSLEPDYPEVQCNLGIALSQTGRPREAIDHYQQAIKLQPNDVDSHYNLGNAFKALGQYQQAIEQYEIVLQLTPNFFEGYVNIGLAYASIGRSSEAITAAQKALELAQSQRQTSRAKQIEDWLKSYRTGQSNPADASPSGDINSPP